ncbi:MAG: hypothetical protein V8T86_05255 [Victivallis sp.]
MTWSGRELLDCFEPYPGASLTADGTVRIVTTAEAPRLACRAGALHPTGKYLIVEMAACGGESAELFLHGVWWERTGRRIMLIADGKFHRYNLDLGNVDPDDAEIYATHLLPTDAPGAEVKIESMRFSDLPEGEPSIRFHWAGMGEAFNRIGQGPREFVVSLENQGGEGSRDLEIAELTLPPGVRVAAQDEAWRKLPPIGANDCCNGRFPLEADAPVKGEFAIRLKGTNAPAEAYRGTLEFLPDLGLPKADYVPEPTPADTGDIELGALYFPGWTSTGRWDTIIETAPGAPSAARLLPGRRPRAGRLADQVGGRVRHQIPAGRLVLECGPDGASRMAGRLREVALQVADQVGDDVGEPQSARHALGAGPDQRHAALDRSLLQHAGLLQDRRQARGHGLDVGEYGPRPRRRRFDEAARTVAGDGAQGRLPRHLLHRHEVAGGRHLARNHRQDQGGRLRLHVDLPLWSPAAAA